MKPEDRRFFSISPYALLGASAVVSSAEALSHINTTFKQLRDAGVTDILWHASICGKALYHTRVATALSGDTRYRGRLLEAMLKSVDFLEAAATAGRNCGLSLSVVCRPYDDYFPGLACDFEASHQHCLWESRDGQFRLRGVLSMAYEEVRCYRLAVVEELASYDVDRVVIDLDSNAACMTPFRRMDFFGYNDPIAHAHLERFGEDIRAFDDIEYRRGHDLQIVDAHCLGGQFNRDGWHRLKGEYFETFLGEASRIVKAAHRRFGLLRGRIEGILPMARMSLPADSWLKNGLLDDLFLPYGAGEDRPLAAYLAARSASACVITSTSTNAGDGAIVNLGDIIGASRVDDGTLA